MTENEFQDLILDLEHISAEYQGAATALKALKRYREAVHEYQKGLEFIARVRLEHSTDRENLELFRAVSKDTFSKGASILNPKEKIHD